MATVNGFITDGTISINFTAQAQCVGGTPTGSISGTINDIFTGGPVLEDFTFSSASPLLVGENLDLNLIHIVYENVTVTNVTTGEVFTGGTAIVTADVVSATSWEGSVTVLFNDHVLTFFGLFTGSAEPTASVICQQLL